MLWLVVGSGRRDPPRHAVPLPEMRRGDNRVFRPCRGVASLPGNQAQRTVEEGRRGAGVNRNKARGTAFESAIRDYARTHGFPEAPRIVPAGAKDLGDVVVCKGATAEAKNCTNLAVG